MSPVMSFCTSLSLTLVSESHAVTLNLILFLCTSLKMSFLFTSRCVFVSEFPVGLLPQLLKENIPMVSGMCCGS